VTEALDVARTALRETDGWLVGGAVRDRMLGRPVKDLDLVVASADVRGLARQLAVEAGGPAFELSDAFGAWRVIGPGRAWQVDVTPLQGSTIEEDLALRDFTVNAIAEPLEGGALVDPYDGAGDVRERRLRMVSEEAFDADPLRTLRLARFACQLGLEPEAATIEAARARAERIAEVAPERVFAELKRIVASDEALAGLALMDELALTEQVLPELHRLRGVEQNPYHHLDVRDHTLETLRGAIDLERDPAAVVGPELGPRVAEFLAQPLADELTRGEALRFGALLHDAAKPQTRAVTPEGRVTFLGHDRAGADLARAVLARLRTSERLRAHVAGLALHHLRAGFLVHRQPLTRRDVYGYLTACEPVEVDVTLLSIADRLATRGRKADEAVPRHMDLAKMLLSEALDWHERPLAEPLVRGDDLATELGIRPGPRLGEVLAAIDEARFAGEVGSRDEAIEFARSWLEPS
jgi:putative nucleotidyltransferase with HDIG domain